MKTAIAGAGYVGLSLANSTNQKNEVVVLGGFPEKLPLLKVQ